MGSATAGRGDVSRVASGISARAPAATGANTTLARSSPSRPINGVAVSTARAAAPL